MDAVYNVRGAFGTSTFLGPLDGGRLDGTFSAPLPPTSGFETINTFDINLVDSFGDTLANRTGSNGSGLLAVDRSGSWALNGTLGNRDEFLFQDSRTGSFLELCAAPDFISIHIFPTHATIPANAFYTSFAGANGGAASTDCVFTGGSITAAGFAPIFSQHVAPAPVLCRRLFADRNRATHGLEGDAVVTCCSGPARVRAIAREEPRTESYATVRAAFKTK